MSERIAAAAVAALVALVVLTACAPRVDVVDAVSGTPVAAQVKTLDGGRILVEANGYEMWSGPRTDVVALQPLWQARFMKPGEVKRPAAPPCANCPGKRLR